VIHIQTLWRFPSATIGRYLLPRNYGPTSQTSDKGGRAAVIGIEDLVVVRSDKSALGTLKDRLDKFEAPVERIGKAGYGW
jgi:hypothetical protein